MTEEGGILRQSGLKWDSFVDIATAVWLALYRDHLVMRPAAGTGDKVEPGL